MRAVAKVVEPGAEPPPRLPLAPLQAWLRKLIEAERREGWKPTDAYERVAKLLCIERGELNAWLVRSGTGWIAEDVADRLVSRHGGYMLEEVYAPVVERAPRPEREPRIRTCARPGCNEPVEGTREVMRDRRRAFVPSLHCAAHRDELARVREQLDEDGRRMSANGGASNKRTRPARPVPTCTRPGCYEPRKPPASLCAVCRAMGWEEEE